MVGKVHPTLNRRTSTNAYDEKRQKTPAAKPGAAGQEPGREVGHQNAGPQGPASGGGWRYCESRGGIAAGGEKARPGRHQASDSSQCGGADEVAAGTSDSWGEDEDEGDGITRGLLCFAAQ